MNTVKKIYPLTNSRGNPKPTIENLIALLKALFIPYQPLSPEQISITIGETTYEVNSFYLVERLKQTNNFLSRIESEIAKAGLPARTITHLNNAISDLRLELYPKPKPKPTPPQKSPEEIARSKTYGKKSLAKLKAMMSDETGDRHG